MKRELMGPGSECRELADDSNAENEVISELPESRYSVGILFPQENQQELDDDEVSKNAGAIDDTDIVTLPDDKHRSENGLRDVDPIVDDMDAPSLDETISLSSQRLPSSMGFTFFMENDFNELRFKIDLARYRNAKDRYNKFSLLKCPWCGTKLIKDDVDKKIVGALGYRMVKGHFGFFCVQEGCHFEG